MCSCLLYMAASDLLKETRESNNRQLELAKQSHDEQVKESQMQFYS